ncbi:phosphate transporter [Ectobacillus sp. JY-23]|uniref:phosphate transporter n=1 Tax=Ectobacillus sp. JY-23 TaxID=2933872 RepID=UPI001FF182E5|nr:phosphate transporter [Ectobacillus sp. JY-23]UOY92398.1 phosphate transporter [Ectobacillus sp. JY-23]
MNGEYYIKKQRHTLVLINHDKYNELTGEYEVFPKTIHTIIKSLHEKYPLYIYYMERYGAKKDADIHVTINSFLKRRIVIIEPLCLADFNEEYIGERYIFSSENINNLLENLRANKFNDLHEVTEVLKDNCDIVCKIFDSAYI